MERSNSLSSFREIKMSQDEFHGKPAQGCDYFGLNDLYLPDQERRIKTDLRPGRCTVSGWTVFHNVGDKNILPFEAVDLKKCIKVFASPAYERSAGLGFIFPRCFTDEEDLCIRISFTWNRLEPIFNPMGIERRLGEIDKSSFNCFQFCSFIQR